MTWVEKGNWHTVARVKKAKLVYCGVCLKGSNGVVCRGLKRWNRRAVARIKKAKFVYCGAG